MPCFMANFRAVLGMLLIVVAGSVFAVESAPALLTVPLLLDDQIPWRPPEALAVRVHLRHPGSEADDTPAAPILIDAGKPWSEAVALSVFGPDGQPVSLPWTRSGNQEIAPFSLQLGNEWTMGFFLPADAGRALPPGRYTLRSTLEITGGTGWTGRVSSAEASIEVASPPPSGSGIAAAVIGSETLSPGDPWVVALSLLPPVVTGNEDALRSRYQVSVRDEAGRDLAWAFDPAATPPTMPSLAALQETGLSPILVTLPGSTTAQAPPGLYEITARWQAGATGPIFSNRVSVRLMAKELTESLPERAPAVLRQRFAEATALLWRAEYSTTAQIETLTARAAPLLVEAERLALRNYTAAPRQMETAAVVAELNLLAGDFEGARAFALLARGSWEPPAVTPEVLAAAGPPSAPAELTELLNTIELRAAQNPGRVLPVLRPAVVAARGFDSGNPDSFAPGEAAWAVSAKASSEYRATDYSASQATNAPNVPSHADHPKAWAPKLADAGDEWLELTYAPPFRAAGIQVIQSFNPGAIMRLEVIDEAGAASTVWTGPDLTPYAARTIGILRVAFPPTERPIARVRVTLDTRRVAGWNEIDAVRLIAAPKVESEAPALSFHLDPTNPGTLTIPNWPSGFRLERATRLIPADWSPVVTNPPLILRLDRPAEFLRLRQAP